MVLKSDEDIRSLIPEEEQPEPKIPIYHSKYSSTIREEVQQRKKCHQTMGYAKIQLDPPSKFLKKQTRIVRRPQIDKLTKPNIDRKPALPPVKVKSMKEKKTEKNFRQENVVRAMRSVPRKPKPAFTDTPHGDKQQLLPSGMIPMYIYKQGYGKIPKYLLDRQRAEEEKEKAIKERQKKKRPPLRYITEDERQELLEGLKKNWQDLQKEFQLLPMVTDTVPKIKRKTQLEKELKGLEKDIELIERNPIIYIDEDQGGHNNDGRHQFMNRVKQQCKKPTQQAQQRCQNEE